MKIFNDYIKEIKEIKDELEHSGRTFLQNLLTNFTNSHKINIIHESKRDKQGRGAPDFKFLFNDTEIGYLENKKIGEDLDEVLKSDQIRKYKTLTDNLILTDYLRWIWIYQGEIVKDIRLCEKSLLEQKTITLNQQNCQDLTALINDFLSQKPQEITKASELAKILASPTRTIKEEIEIELERQIKEKNKLELEGLFDVFKENIFAKITVQEFADAFAQTLTYSLFLTKLNLQNPNQKLLLNNISSHIPQSFALIKDILKFIQVLDKYSTLKPYIERILHIVNHINAFELANDLKFTQDEEKDPYIYFYEDFLKVYDPKIRVDAGVYYTPEPVVRSIISNIHNLLKTDFNLDEGLADNSVKILDFACGTGTFLFQIYSQILGELAPNSLKKSNLIKNHILKNIFGFELLIPAYCVSHLKLSQYLKENANYSLDDDDRIRVYLTNTLENREKSPQTAMQWIIPEIANEGKSAQEIKENNDIIVITGNPPYNGTSQNNFIYIQDLIKPYFPNDEIKEKQVKWLQDDYVKFIRFAENKITNAGKGIVGIITSHSFIDNPTFRAMRQHLMKTFDKIYIIDLHGNSKKKEKCQDGTLDQNVFDIQQGVAISFFVKNPAIKAEERGIYHLDIFGKRKSKFEQISEIDLTKTAFSKINPSAPFYLFIPQNQKVREEYEKGWSLRDVFLESVSGITTADDNFLFDFKSEDLLKKINEKTGEIVDNKFIKAVNYRPFDLRKVFYIKTKKDNPYKNLQIPLGYRSRADVMGHFLDKENVGLAFCRQINQEFYHCFISNKIMESCFVSNKTGEITSIAPLYLYKKEEVMDITTETKVPNFKPEFVKMLNSHFNSFNNSPLEGLSLQKHDSRNNNSPLEGLSLQKHDSLSNNSPLEGESNGLMPFGGGSKRPLPASPTSWLCDPPSRGG
ncbi:MAG: N-6 DNA methylase [Rickettsiales bacterium]|nr:N-6 DNA methylase [Rickettsiales bacterium]